MLTVRAPESGIPQLSLCEGRTLGSGLSSIGQAQPVALASGDFDGDGMPDLVSGFSSGNSGRIAIHRGNVNALWPYGAALRNGPPPAFLPNPRSFSIPESPDFIAIGDFDADGRLDIVTAHPGSSNLYFLRGDGRGGFGAAQPVPLGGAITAMISGEINRADGLADIVVAVNT
ncbi:MAG TPA: VCBS repeat-containing protein, partial [Acidobacteriaceae bacterium]|nr:VCBS repeat-containing protein [Acidobacteriaceae bacterium]